MGEEWAALFGRNTFSVCVASIFVPVHCGPLLFGFGTSGSLLFSGCLPRIFSFLNRRREEDRAHAHMRFPWIPFNF